MISRCCRKFIPDSTKSKTPFTALFEFMSKLDQFCYFPKLSCYSFRIFFGCTPKLFVLKRILFHLSNNYVIKPSNNYLGSQQYKLTNQPLQQNRHCRWLQVPRLLQLVVSYALPTKTSHDLTAYEGMCHVRSQQLDMVLLAFMNYCFFLRASPLHRPNTKANCS